MLHRGIGEFKRGAKSPRPIDNGFIEGVGSEQYPMLVHLPVHRVTGNRKVHHRVEPILHQS
jgi:hypothetical protein